uniref:Uncharacterized protein n=1 Tax=Callorhinchus milii TaxID=7868 RepID=A0A4W3JKB5_CALMI
RKTTNYTLAFLNSCSNSSVLHPPKEALRFPFSYCHSWFSSRGSGMSRLWNISSCSCEWCCTGFVCIPLGSAMFWKPFVF